MVEDVSLTIEPGEIVGLLGPNGAGKTTCFYMLVGLVKADSGEVLLDKQTLTNAPMHGRASKGIGYLPQEAGVKDADWKLREHWLATLNTCY